MERRRVRLQAALRAGRGDGPVRAARWLLLTAALAAACSPQGRAAPPGVILVSLDTVRADRTSLLGYERPTTPNLERLAREGASFTRAYTMSATTGPSHATLFTGRYAPAHGIYHNGVSLGPAQVTLAEHLRNRGYETAGVIGSFVLSGRFGFDQGFDVWDEEFSAEESSLPLQDWEGHVVPGGGFDRPGEAITQRALSWLGRNRSRPFFLFVHYFDAHEPYDPAPEWEARFPAATNDPEQVEVARYDAEIAEVDAQVGALLDGLDRLGLAERTLVVVTTDHGQGLLDHDDAYHGTNIYEEAVRGVLLLRWPGRIPAGSVLDVPVMQVDVAPTLLDLLSPGSHAELGLPGRSLAGLLLGRARGGIRSERPIFLYRQWYPPHTVRGTPVRGEQFGVRVGHWKYLEGNEDGRRELYDLSRDPGERINRIEESDTPRDRLAQTLAKWRARHARGKRVRPRLNDRERQKLRALGYVE